MLLQLPEGCMLAEARRSCAICSCLAPKDAQVVFQHRLLRLTSRILDLELLLLYLAIAYQLEASLH